MATAEGNEEYKMVVLGSGAVGKSALTIRLVTQNFLEEYDPTIEDNYNKTINVDSIPAHLDILDTAGQDEYSQMQDQWMREGKGILVVYAVDNWTSFTDVQKYKEKIDRVKENEDYALVLVGNKCDLESTREVTKEQGQSLATEWGCPFFEASAKNKINHEECFFQVVREIRKLNARPAVTEEKKSFFKRCIIL
ncbi:K-RAS [Symbiodinium microadriaticum]|nr:K-RAS [Symbiodinium microadriaticum]